MTQQPEMETIESFPLNDAIRQVVNEAYVPNDRPLLVAYINEQGQPTMTFRGSIHVHSDTQLGIWARRADGGLVRGLAQHPEVHLLYREPNPAGGYSLAMINFRGRARVIDVGPERDAIYRNSPEREQQADAEQAGVGIVVDLDSVTGYMPGYRLNITR